MRILNEANWSLSLSCWRRETRLSNSQKAALMLPMLILFYSRFSLSLHYRRAEWRVKTGRRIHFHSFLSNRNLTTKWIAVGFK